MSFKKRGSLLLFTCIIIISGSCVTPGSSVLISTGDVIILTDIHFDPLYDILSGEQQKAMMDLGITAEEYLAPGFDAGKLAELRDGWDKLFNSLSLQEAAAAPRKNPETNNKIFQPLLDKMKGSKPSFMLFLGDFLTYAFRDVLDISPPEDKQKLQFSCILYVLEKIRQTLGPEVPIHISLGNSDTFDANFSTEYGNNFAPAMQRCMNFYGRINQELIPETPLGYNSYNENIGDYTVEVINIDTNYLTEDWNNNGQVKKGAGEVLDYLETSISASEHVWVTMHIPPGLDVYQTDFQSNSQSDEPISVFWHEDNTKKFMEILDAYGERIDFMFAGHTHVSEYKIFDRGNYNYVILNPGAGGMRNGQNPGFSVLTLNENGLLKQTVYAVMGNTGEVYVAEEIGGMFYDKNIAGVRINSLIKEENSFSAVMKPFETSAHSLEITEQQYPLTDEEKTEYLIFRRTGRTAQSPGDNQLSEDFWAAMFIHTNEDFKLWEDREEK